MADNPEREVLLRETHRLQSEIGYAGFRLEYFNDAAAIKEWPDAATRDRELQAFWSSQAEQAYPSYRDKFADVGTDDLAALRDQLRASSQEAASITSITTTRYPKQAAAPTSRNATRTM